MTEKKSGRERLSLTVQILVCLLGLASWIDINGLWTELPLMVYRLPEGWDLPSYLIIIIQIANVGPLTFGIVSRFTNRRIEIPTNYLIISIGGISCLLLAFLWHRTSVVGGSEHSTALLSLAMLLALVDCTSSVSFLSFMSIYPAGYMTAYLIGEELTGLIPSLAALIQGVGGNAECRNDSVPFVNETLNITQYELTFYYPPARFSVQGFFLILFAILLCSFIAFVMLNHLPAATKHRVPDERVSEKGDAKSKNSMSISKDRDDFAYINKGVQVDLDGETSFTDISGTAQPNGTVQDNDTDKNSTKRLSISTWAYLLIIVAWLNGLKNGVLPSVQSYSALPYGNVAYHLCITLSLLVKPFIVLVAHFVPTKKLSVIGFVALCGTATGCYIFYLALLSPTPVLCGSTWGEALVVVAWIVNAVFFTYAEVVICILCRKHGRKALIWYGISSQIGSLIGSVIIFTVLNNMDLFTSNNPCDDTCYN
ncbi:solute carrier family 52, riboflavin transporter, member 3-B-like [Ptychodera flava]|uniref:solute carrier family 52, riboflavin transporter, member 3-B-like n=1 Tax=Ptychodera flava TaxID=63121 RepID=UPI00396AAF3E